MKYSVRLHEDHKSESVLQDISTLVWREGMDQVDLNSTKLDPVAALFISVCRVSMMEKLFIDQGLIDVVSPQLSATVAWCLGQVSHPYLCLSEDSYNQVRECG